MKNRLFVLALVLIHQNAFATCASGVKSFYNMISPTATSLKITGLYTHKSKKTKTHLPCEVIISLEESHLTPDLNPAHFNPNYGDGGAFWPFGTYPIVERVSDDYQTVISQTCISDKDGFNIDFVYREKSGWRKLKRFSLSLFRSEDQLFTLALRDGTPSLPAVACRGTVSAISSN